MRRRAMGQETEYSLMLFTNRNYQQSVAVNAGLLLGIQSISSHQFLTNGSRFYLDLNNHPEYATGECDSPEQIIAHAMAGDMLLAQRALAYCKAWRAIKHRPIDFRIYRNNICGYGATEQPFGTHENYQITETTKVQELLEPLMAYLVTRQLVLGAGRYRILHNGRASFELAQRSGFMLDTYSTATTTNRPIVNLRNEAHAKGSSRLHLISGDNSILPQNTGLKFAMMDVLLTLLEEKRLKHVTLARPVEAIHLVSCRPDTPLELVDGTHMTALEIQAFYHEQVQSFVESDNELAGKLFWVREYGRHLERLAESLEPEAHIGELCWATKAVILEGLRKRERTPEQLQADELSMHEIVQPASISSIILRRYGRYDQEAAQRAMVEPPLTTRAYARGTLLATTTGLNQINWSQLTNTTAKKTYKLPDPLDPTTPEFIALTEPDSTAAQWHAYYGGAGPMPPEAAQAS